jgi:hypothetical protein
MDAVRADHHDADRGVVVARPASDAHADRGSTDGHRPADERFEPGHRPAVRVVAGSGRARGEGLAERQPGPVAEQGAE